MRRISPSSFGSRVVVAVALLLSTQFFAVHAQTSREKAIRTVLLFNIAQLTDWPKSAFNDESEPFIIGVMGSDPFGGALEETFKNETVRGRKVTIEYYENAEAIKKPHLLYVSGSQARYLAAILEQMQDWPALIVADVERAERRGAMVHLFWEDNRAKMIINTQAVTAKGLTMSPRLLAVAQRYP
jgi:hypothetical protein